MFTYLTGDSVDACEWLITRTGFYMCAHVLFVGVHISSPRKADALLDITAFQGCFSGVSDGLCS